MKKSFLKTLSISLAALMGLGGLAGLAFSSKKEANLVKAVDEELVAELNSSDIAKMSVGLTSYNNSYGTWVIDPQVGGIPESKDLFSMQGADTGGSGVGASVTIDTGRENLTRVEVTYSAMTIGGGTYKPRIFIYRGKPGGKYGEYDYKCVNNDIPNTATTSTLNLSELSTPSVNKDRIRISFDILEKTMTIFAVHNIKIYGEPLCDTVTLDKQNGSGGTSSIDAYPGKAMPSISLPSRTGYTFGGYYTGTNGGGTQYYSNTGASVTNWTKGAASKLYAKWTANSYSVSYNANKPLDATSNVTGIPTTSTSCTYDQNYTLASAPSLTGWTFGGWYKDALCSNFVGNAGASVKNTATSGSVTLYPKWSKNSYTVKYNDNKPSAATGSVSGMPSSTATWTYDSNATLASSPSLTGWTFGGWYKDQSCTEANKLGNGGAVLTKPNLLTSGGPFNLYAKWTQNQYTVKYNGNKPTKAPSDFPVTGVPGNSTWTYDSNATLGSAPSLTGYVFDGWYKDQSCTEANKLGNGGAILTKPNLTPTNNATVNLYAKWKFNDVVQNVVNKINETKLCTYEQLTDKIGIADTAYNALNIDLQKVIISEGYKTILDNAKAADAAGQLIEDIGNAQDTQAWRNKVSAARDAYDDLDDKSFIPLDPILQILLDDEAAIVVMDKINAIGDPHWTTPSKTLIDDAQSAYDSYIAAHHPHSKIANFATLEAANDDYDKVDDFVNLVDGIAPSPYIYSSTLKDKIDEAREWYEETLIDRQKALVQEKDESIYHAHEYYDRLVNYENAYEASRLIDVIDEIENTPECKAKIEAAREALDALNETSELPLVDPALIKELEDDEAAFAVIELINAIYPMSYGEDCENAIQAARDAYEALDDSDQKPKVVNLGMLIKAEEDYARVVEVVGKVDDIGDIRHDEDSLNRIHEARDAYEALTVDQKGFFPEDVLQQIVDYEKAYEALNKFYEIGEVSYDTDSEEKINEAKAYYDSLSDAQKELIHAEDLKVLTRSLEEYQKLQKNANILVIIMLIFVCLTIVGGALFLFFLLRRKKDDEEKEGKGTVKVASVGGLLPLITLASHYVDAPFLALYILSGVAVILWLSILGLVLYRKFKKPEVVGVSSEASLALSSGAQEEANAILQSIKKDEEESKLVVDKKGNLFQIRYIKSFTAKLSQSSDLVKEQYNELKNKVLSYKGVTSRVSWHYDSINVSKEAIVKFAIRGKTLCVYFSPKIENPGEGFKLEESKGRRYEKVPYLFRIKSDKKFEQVKELIVILMKRFKLVQVKLLEDDYKIPFETTEVLLQKGLIKELAKHLEVKEEVKKELLKSVAVEKVDELMSDDTAEALIEEDTVNKRIQGKKEIINVDTLSANFKDGDVVNLETLIEKKLVSSKTVYVKVLARGVLDKKLNVDLHDYSIQAVKMILLTGGSVKKIQ